MYTFMNMRAATRFGQRPRNKENDFLFRRAGEYRKKVSVSPEQRALEIREDITDFFRTNRGLTRGLTMKSKFQIITDMDGNPAKAEASVRMETGLKQIGALETIDAAQRNMHAMHNLTIMMTRAACSALVQFQQVTGNPKFGMALNVPPQLISQTLAEEILFHIREAKLDPSAFDIEITEQQLLADTPAVLSALKTFRQAGVQLTFDDVGSSKGVNTIEHIASYAAKYDGMISGIKLDIGTTKDHEVLLHGMTESKSAGFATTIEGVENIALLHAIRNNIQMIGKRMQENMQSVFLQGFCFHTPATQEETASVLGNRKSLVPMPS